MVSHTAFYVTTLSANCKPSQALICWLWCFTGGRQVCCCHLLYCKSRFLFWFLCGVTNIKFHRFCPLHYTSACLLFLFVTRFSSFLFPGQASFTYTWSVFYICIGKPKLGVGPMVLKQIKSSLTNKWLQPAQYEIMLLGGWFRHTLLLDLALSDATVCWAVMLPNQPSHTQ